MCTAVAGDVDICSPKPNIGGLLNLVNLLKLGFFNKIPLQPVPEMLYSGIRDGIGLKSCTIFCYWYCRGY